MVRDRSVLVVLNPTSGGAKERATPDGIQRALLGSGAARVEVRTTTGIDDARRWAASAASEGFELVVAAGGDGTVTAVATGVLSGARPIPIGIVPLGTGNGLARVLRLPTDPSGALRSLAAGQAVALDAVEVVSHDCWSLLFLGAGLDAEVNRDASGPQKRRFGFLAYIGAVVRNLLTRRAHRVTLHLDDRRERLTAHTVSVFNAGLLELAGVEVGPPADPHDGQLDVAVFRTPSAWAAAAQVLRLVTGRPGRTELIRARHLRVDSAPPLLVHVDGDVVGTTPLECIVRPAALTFVADATYPGTEVGSEAAAAP